MKDINANDIIKKDMKISYWIHSNKINNLNILKMKEIILELILYMKKKIKW